MIATKVLAELEAEAAERMNSGHNQHTSPSQRFDEGSEGRAADKAAKITGTNRQYVSDAKKLQAERPDL